MAIRTTFKKMAFIIQNKYAAKCQEMFVIRQYQNDSGWVLVTGFFEEYIVFQTSEITFS
jgi:hypothetical protein